MLKTNQEEEEVRKSLKLADFELMVNSMKMKDLKLL
jgi:hypothetical protein